MGRGRRARTLLSVADLLERERINQHTKEIKKCNFTSKPTQRTSLTNTISL